ncbi:MAG: xylan 1,4-beta-xylosidase [Kiritimatiellia bacterium]|jgi:xylan 1,4-beta-xylosidase|nr:xylan 1,4-beta-xylosidase [Kiritimatiellia bacterium]
MNTIKLTPNGDGGQFRHNFNKVIGSGHLGLALYERTLKHLEMAHRDLGVEYLRCHGLLSGSPDLCSWANQGKAGLNPELGFDTDQLAGEGDVMANYAFIDLIIDRLLDIGIRPFVEIGFMPRILASSRHSLMRWDAYTSPPRDYGLWTELIENLMRHWLKRYGKKEMLNWYYEVWNEPNLDGFWSSTMDEYHKLYAHTVKAVKAADAGFRVGGPSTAGRVKAYIDEFLTFCHETNTPVDFVTSHSYSANTSARKGEFSYHQVAEPTFLPNRFQQMRDEIDRSPIPDLPLHITEYNSTTSTHEIIHDLPFNAAYLARTVSEAQAPDSLSYWAVSDIFVEETIPRAEFHGGFGMINIHDIPKPTYHMFHFFSQLGVTVLDRTPNSLFTRRDDGHVVGVLWNPNDSSRDAQQVNYRIKLPDNDTPYTARTLLVDELNANPYRTWEMLGRERNPSREDVERLRESAQPTCHYHDLQRTETCLHLDLTLEKNAVVLVDLIPVEDHSGEYYELDQQFYSNLSLSE